MREIARSAGVGMGTLYRHFPTKEALLNTVLRDALERGRDRVGLEVDADSPTGADGLYTALGWTTSYRTQSWQRELDLPST